MNGLMWLVILLICFLMLKSMLSFIHGGKLKESRFSAEMFYTLLVIYLIVIVGFALIYFLLSFQGIVLVEYGELHEVSILGELIHALYFSGVTLLTIGYGDIVPIGIGRLIALVEALIGYVLPTAFVLRLVQTKRNKT